EAEFETTADFIAYPWLGRFNLFRPLQQPGVVNTTKEFYVDSPDQDLNPIVLKPDDKILIGTPQPPGNPNRLDDAEIVIIESVRQQHGTNIYKIKGSLRRTGSSTAIAAFKLGRSFHHFGYNAPQTFVDTSLPVKSTTTDTATGSETTTTINESPLSFERSLNGATSSPANRASFASPYFASGGLMSSFLGAGSFSLSATSMVKPPVTVVSPPLQADEIPLDQEVQDLPNGAIFLMQLGSSVVIRKIESIATGAMKWGQQSGTTSVVKVDANLAFAGHNSADIRELVLYEVLTPRLTLKAAQTPAPQTSGSDLYFYG